MGMKFDWSKYFKNILGFSHATLRLIENGLEKRKYLVGKGVVDVRGQMGQESSQTDLR